MVGRPRGVRGEQTATCCAGDRVAPSAAQAPLPVGDRVAQRRRVRRPAHGRRLRVVPVLLWLRAVQNHDFRDSGRILRRAGHHGGRPPAVGAPVLQRPAADARAVGRVPDARVPEPHLRVGARPPGAPQVHGHGRGPAQLDPRLLLLAHGLADGAQTPGRQRQGPELGHGRPGGRPGGHVSEKILLVAGAVRDVSGAVPNSVLAVERTVLVLVRSGRRLPLHVVAAFYVVSEQRRSHLGHETVRQEHHADGEPDGGAAGVWRGMAQLPSRVPVGLQGGRAGQLPAELQHGVHRRVRAPRAGVRPEDGRPASGGQAVPEDGRRDQRRWPPSGRLGLGRRRNGRGRQAGRPDAQLIAVCPHPLPSTLPPPRRSVFKPFCLLFYF